MGGNVELGKFFIYITLYLYLTSFRYIVMIQQNADTMNDRGRRRATRIIIAVSCFNLLYSSSISNEFFYILLGTYL
jgi:hypothetical protein